METNVVGSSLVDGNLGLDLLRLFPLDVGGFQGLDGHGSGLGYLSDHHLDTLVCALVPGIKSQAVLLASLEMECRRNQPIISGHRLIVGVPRKPVFVAIVCKMPRIIVFVCIDDGERLLFIECLERVEVRILFDGLEGVFTRDDDILNPGVEIHIIFTAIGQQLDKRGELATVFIIVHLKGQQIVAIVTDGIDVVAVLLALNLQAIKCHRAILDGAMHPAVGIIVEQAVEIHIIGIKAHLDLTAEGY